MLYFCSERPGGFGGTWGDIYQAPIIPVVDFNGDGIVNINDLVILIEHWGTRERLCDIGPTPLGDGVVDKADLEVLMSYWGQEVLDHTLIAYWALDETEGIVACDSIDNNDGIVYGEPIWQPDGGMVDGALEFDGIDDYVSTPFVLNPETNSLFSVFAWIKGGAPGQIVLSQIDGADWLLIDPSEGYLMTELKGSSRFGAPLFSQTVITDGRWHRIGFVWDGSQRMLYVDDVESAKDTQSQGQLISADGGLYIGAGNKLETGTFCSGLIDDVRIYSRAITP